MGFMIRDITAESVDYFVPPAGAVKSLPWERVDERLLPAMVAFASDNGITLSRGPRSLPSVKRVLIEWARDNGSSSEYGDETSSGGEHPDDMPKVEARKAKAEGGKDFAAIHEALGIDVESITAEVLEAVDAKIESIVTRPNVIQVAGLPEVKMEGELLHFQFGKLLALLVANVIVMLTGAPGIGKSFVARQVARVLSEGDPDAFFMIAGSGAPQGAELRGFIDAAGNYQTGLLYRAAKYAAETGRIVTVLFDEMDAFHPSSSIIMNDVMANRFMSFPNGETLNFDNVRFLAAANTHGRGGTIDFAGRNALDAATLDRFFVLDFLIDNDIEEKVAFGIDAAAAAKVLPLIRKYRRNVQAEGLRVFVTPRSTYNAVRAVASGAFTVDEAMAGSVFKGLPDAQVAKIKGNR